MQVLQKRESLSGGVTSKSGKKGMSHLTRHYGGEPNSYNKKKRKMANRQNKSYLLSKRKKGKAFLLQNQEKMPSTEQKSLKFRYEDFVMEDIPNLMINIWSYLDEHGTGCNICTMYKKMCVQALKNKNGAIRTKT